MSTHRILIVEDNPADADYVRERLADGPVGAPRTEHVATMAEAQARLADGGADAVILDLRLPDSDGLDTVRRLKAASGEASIIVVSGMVDEAARAAALQAGVDEVFSKDDMGGPLFARSVLHLIERGRAVREHSQFERILETIPDAILVVNVDGLVRYVNEAALALFGRRREDFIDELLGFSVKDGQAIEVTILRRGDERICEMRVERIDWNEEEAYLASIRDVTERRRMVDALRASERRLRLSETHFAAAQRIAAVGSFVKDLETGALTGTPQFYRIFGLEPAGPDDWNDYWSQAVSEEERARIESHSDAAKQGERPKPVEFEFLRKDGARRVALRDADVVFDERGRPTALLGVIRDVTDLRMAEARSRTLNRELEARVRSRTAQLEAANRELEAFSYSVSHDLRAPLRAIDGFSRILLDEHVDELSPKAQHCLEVVRVSTLQMSHLIDDLLSFSRIGRQKLRRVSVDVEEIARQVAADLRSAEPERRVEMRIGSLPSARGDPMLVRLVLQNLLENAFKYTRGRSTAKIEVGCVAQDDPGEEERVYFVRDNGVGFDMRFANKLFGVFQRLHSPEDYEGTGVGLAIVQRIIQRHGGQVWADAKPGRGAMFCFSLGDAAADRSVQVLAGPDSMLSASRRTAP
ncbi:PAS domain S-box protein [Phenylobacterium sp.]|uniref:PAS domain S-box protein n=1 Tax=Phenylobacterium sp. TaxID=1871053 RepID=UPI0035B4B899